MQSIDSMEAYAYGTSKYLVNDKEEIKCKVKHVKMLEQSILMIQLI